MLNKLRKQTEGFTIIEVLIVLAIAALILLIIFFAVPALQRNNRNTQLRNDASVVLGFANDFASNNNGAIPGTVCNDATGNVGMVASGACNATANNVGKIRANVTINMVTSTPATPATGTLYVASGYKCNGNVIGAATTRAIAVYYLTETAGANSDNCAQS